MTNIVDTILLIEFILAVVVVLLNIREVLFLRSLTLESKGEDLWLLKAMSLQQVYISFVGMYLLFLTGLSTIIGTISSHIPWIRPVNGLILLLVIAGPIYVGRQMRKRRGKVN